MSFGHVLEKSGFRDAFLTPTVSDACVVMDLILEPGRDEGHGALSEPLSPHASVTPDLDTSAFSGVTTPTTLGSCPSVDEPLARGAASARRHLDMFGHDMRLILGDQAASSSKLLGEPLEARLGLAAPPPAHWLSSATEPTASLPRELAPHTPQHSDVPQRKRARHHIDSEIPSTYQPPMLLPMGPRALAPGPDTLRAWLLERRALLQKAHDDVTRAAAHLRADEARWTELRAQLAARIGVLRKKQATVVHPTALLKDAFEPWGTDDMGSVSDLLEQDILCL